MKKIMLLVLALFVLSSNVFGLGIAWDYIEGDTIYLENGESRMYGIRIQNMEDSNKTISLNYTCEICEIIDYQKSYFILANTKKNAINFNITFPKDANKKDIYSLSYYIMKAENGEGQISTALKISGGNLKLKHVSQEEIVGEEEKNEGNNKIWYVIPTVILISGLGLILIKKA